MTPQFAIQQLIASGRSQASIAEEVGCSQSTINRIGLGQVKRFDYALGAALIELARKIRKRKTA